MNQHSLSKSDQLLVKYFLTKWCEKCSKRAITFEQTLFDEESIIEEPENNKASHQPAWSKPIFKRNQADETWWKNISNFRWSSTVNPETDNLYFLFQFLSTLFWIYNACFIPLRSSFPYQTDQNMFKWFIFDYISDLVYLFDIVVFQRRRQYLERGCSVNSLEKTKLHYYKSKRFKRDLISLLPSDLLYFVIGYRPVLRVNRLIKIDSYNEFNNMFEMKLKQAFTFRVARTTAYLLYVIHLDACLYFYISYMKDFTSPWGYNLEGNAYVRCYFWAFMNITNIGNVPDPVSTTEYIFQFLHYFIGLFIYSIVIGQVRDSVQAATAEVEAYRDKKNACINYLEKNNISDNIQKKVRLWFEYTWNTQRILEENKLLQQMPGKMNTEIAISVHMEVLQKVEIFKECDQQLLFDLLTKLQPVLYLPGDYVCKKGEVGREMFIITNGMVQVVGEKISQVFATLYPGTAFGEISLLAVGGGNRRTANIYSPGYTTLFLLYKQDLNEVLINYPAAQQILKKKAEKMLNKDKSNKPAGDITTSAEMTVNKSKVQFDVVNIITRAMSTKSKFR